MLERRLIDQYIKNDQRTSNMGTAIIASCLAVIVVALLKGADPTRAIECVTAIAVGGGGFVAFSNRVVNSSTSIPPPTQEPLP